MEITAKIIKSFEIKAPESHRIPLVIILPMCKDLVYFKENSCWVYEPLLERLYEMEVEFLNLGIGLIKYLDQNNPEELYIDCSDHFNETGERIVANLIFDELKAKNLVQTNP